MQDSNQEMNSTEIEQLLARLRESIDIYERKPEEQETKQEEVIEEEAEALEEATVEEEATAEDAPTEDVSDEEDASAHETLSEDELDQLIKSLDIEELTPQEAEDENSDEMSSNDTDSFELYEDGDEEIEDGLDSVIEEFIKADEEMKEFINSEEADAKEEAEEPFVTAEDEADEENEEISVTEEDEAYEENEEIFVTAEDEADEEIEEIFVTEEDDADEENEEIFVTAEDEADEENEEIFVTEEDDADEEIDEISVTEDVDVVEEIEEFVAEEVEDLTNESPAENSPAVDAPSEDTVPFSPIKRYDFPLQSQDGAANVGGSDEEEANGGEAKDYSAYRIAPPKEAQSADGKIEEFTSKEQVEQIERNYRRDKKVLLCKMIPVGALALLLFLLQSLLFFGIPLEKLVGIENYPFILPLLALQCLFICILLTYTQIKEGIYAFLERRMVPESYYITAEIWTVLYGILACIQCVALRDALTFAPLLTSFGCALSFLVLLSDYLCLLGEHATFRAIAQPGDKLAAEISRLTARPEEYRLLRNTGASRTLHVKKVEFVDGYFRQMNRRIEDFSLNFWILVAVNSAAFILFVLGGFVFNSLSPALGAMTACACVFFAAPLSFFLAHRYPTYCAARIASSENCAFVGESAVQMYSLADVMVFEDVEAFNSVNTRIRRIKLPSSVQIHQVLYYLTKAFGVIGGPLFGLFSTATEGVDDYSDTTLISSEQDGLHVRVGHRDVHIGSAAYLASNGIEPYYDDEDEKYRAEGKISLMYVALDGTFMAKFYIQYEPNGKFCRNAKRLTLRHMHLLIRTYDPNINEGLLASHPTMASLPIRVVHKKPEQLHDYAEARMYSGLVTSGSTKDILKLLLLCDNVKTVQRLARVGKILASVCGVALAALLLFSANLVWLLSPLSFVYCLLWLLPLAIITKRKL